MVKRYLHSKVEISVSSKGWDSNYHRVAMATIYLSVNQSLKGKSVKNGSAQMKVWKMQKKMSHHWPQWIRQFLRYPIPKSRIFAMKIAKKIEVQYGFCACAVVASTDSVFPSTVAHWGTIVKGPLRRSVGGESGTIGALHWLPSRHRTDN